jgi:hypothetical protein
VTATLGAEEDGVCNGVLERRRPVERRSDRLQWELELHRMFGELLDNRAAIFSIGLFLLAAIFWSVFKLLSSASSFLN